MRSSTRWASSPSRRALARSTAGCITPHPIRLPARLIFRFSSPRKTSRRIITWFPRLYAPATFFAQIPTPAPRQTPAMAPVQPTPPPDESQGRTTLFLGTLACFGCGGFWGRWACLPLLSSEPNPRKRLSMNRPRSRSRRLKRQARCPTWARLRLRCSSQHEQGADARCDGPRQQRRDRGRQSQALQLTVVNAQAATEDYEKVLIEGIAEDGTLPKK